MRLRAALFNSSASGCRKASVYAMLITASGRTSNAASAAARPYTRSALSRLALGLPERSSGAFPFTRPFLARADPHATELVPWISDFPHISTRSRRRSLRCTTLKYEEYSGGRAPCERRRSRADICEKSLIQGTSECPRNSGSYAYDPQERDTP